MLPLAAGGDRLSTEPGGKRNQLDGPLAESVSAGVGRVSIALGDHRWLGGAAGRFGAGLSARVVHAVVWCVCDP